MGYPRTVDPELLRTLKALADASRLRIVGLLATRPMAVQELAESLTLSPATVVHHLRRLGDAGLVEARQRPPYVEYVLRVGRLQEVGRELDRASAAGEESIAELPGPDGRPRPAFEAKVLRAFFEGGRLMTIPAQEKKRLVVLRYLAETVFQEPRPYPEKEVNQRIAVIHPDTASLRRYLVDQGFVERSRGSYRLRPREEWPA